MMIDEVRTMPTAVQPQLMRWSVVLPGLTALAVALVLPQFANGYVTEVATTALLYVVLCLGLNIVVGYAGLLDLGYAAFFAVGAYTSGILTAEFGFNFW
ncbi:branched-chain amino acid ABC transporter permease, partial [Mesorhizobium sp. M6A.T.Ce.TU.016.01.1.1]